MTMRRCRYVFAVSTLACQAFLAATGLAAMGLLATPVNAEEPKGQPDTIVFALMSGKCPTLKVARRDFECRAVAFFQTEEGRANFTIALDDPADESHIVTFSGNRGVRTQDNLYELPIDEISSIPATAEARWPAGAADRDVGGKLHADWKPRGATGFQYLLRHDQ